MTKPYVYCDRCKTTRRVSTRPIDPMGETTWCERCHQQHKAEMKTLKTERLEAGATRPRHGRAP